jgi:signal peptidase
MNSKLRYLDRTAIVRALGSVCFLAAMAGAGAGAAAEVLFVSDRIAPPPGEYTDGIEGPAVNAAGDLFVVNIRRPGTAHPDRKGAIGRLKKGAVRSEFFAPLPNGGIGNGTRFDLQGHMYVADYPNHIIHVFEPGSNIPHPYFTPASGQPTFNQPNDLAIARDGTLYASDPGKDGSGRIWRISREPDGSIAGKIMTSLSPRPQGKTNGLDLSPDNKTLYVSESRFKPAGLPAVNAALYSYRIDGLTLADEHKLREFPTKDVDGLRVDTDGRIFLARPDAGEVAILTPDGADVRPPVKTRGTGPTNLTFGGADGRDVYVTQSDGGFIERFRTDRPGREPCLQTPAPAGCTPLPQ